MISDTAEKSFALRLAEKVNPDILHFLEQTSWGSKGLQYYVRNYDHALGRLPDPHFFVLTESGRMIGNVMFFTKWVEAGSGTAPCVYLTQLSVHPDHRGRGIAGRLVRAVVEHAKRQWPDPKAALLTAYIEEANAPSLAVFRKQDFQLLGRFDGTVINRLYPKTCAKAETLPEKDRETMTRLLTELYQGHLLQDFPISLHAAAYRVLRDEKGNIIAGLQAHVEHWQVTQMEGLSGWLVVHALGKISWIGEHLFNPASSRFVHIGNLYARPGREGLLYQLIEDSLAKHHVPFAVGYFDKRSDFFQRFARSGAFGMLNAVMETPVVVMGKFLGNGSSKPAALANRPLVISPLDIS